MNKLIAKIGRENHINHLIQILPFITTIFGIQCFLIYKYFKDVQVGDYALFMGLGLISFVYSLFYYDNNHHVLIYSKHLHIFPVFGEDKKLDYSEIESIHGPDEECNFSTLIIQLKNEDRHVFYFVDYPLHMKNLIEQQLSKKELDEDEDDDSNSDLAA